MKKMKYLLLVMAMTLALVACGSKDEASSEDAVQESVEESTDNAANETEESNTSDEESDDSFKIFGTFTTQTLDGEEVTQDIFAEADLTMVNIWGTFCGPCINEMPGLGEISREYEDKGFQIIGMLCDVTAPGDETALEIVNETQADYMHVVASDDLMSGILQYVTSVPTTIFVDKEGNMVGEAQMGSRDKDSWELLINNLLAGVQ